MIAHRFLANIFYRPYPDLIWRLPDRKKICLTFDDGPYPPVTKQVLKILNDARVPATFFLSGERIFAHRRELKRLSYRGHSLGNHFYHHVPVFGLRAQTIARQLNISDYLIEKNFSQNPALFRPPYGIFSPALLKELRKQNKVLALWSLMANDFKWGAEKVMAHLSKSLRGGDVVVFHDSAKTEKVVVEVLPKFIEHCLEKGYEFETMATVVEGHLTGTP